MNIRVGKTLAATIEADKRHLKMFFEGRRSPVDSGYLAREIARAGFRIYSARMRAGGYSFRLSLIIRPKVVSVWN